jgi:hypothetical protein
VGILQGDVLEAIVGQPSAFGHRYPPPHEGDVLGSLCGLGKGIQWTFPLTLEFRGSACAEILGRDGWTPCHSASAVGGLGSKGDRAILQQLLVEENQAARTEDVQGCKWSDWYKIGAGAAHRAPRPLSASASRHGRLPRGVDSQVRHRPSSAQGPSACSEIALAKKNSELVAPPPPPSALCLPGHGCQYGRQVSDSSESAPTAGPVERTIRASSDVAPQAEVTWADTEARIGFLNGIRSGEARYAVGLR